jgi:hypothetical protein
VARIGDWRIIGCWSRVGYCTRGRCLTRATKTIPIEFAFRVDPVGVGHVASLVHPGGNINRLSMLLTELAAKRFEVLKEANRRSETNWRALEPYDAITLPQPSSTYKY